MGTAGPLECEKVIAPAQQLVLAGAGSDPAAIDAAAQRLASLLALPLDGWPGSGSATARLASLLERPAPRLVPLLDDPGAWIEPDGRWADALGAWRQPTLLLLDAAAVTGGRAAAYSALLEGAAVPLVGLVQWGGSFDLQARRREGLAWLGALSGPSQPAAGSTEEEQELALVRTLRLRWRQLLS
ncbi:hypothetical protein KQ306_03600 [Synechococcus sp. CS-1324]|uniref:hypothetical protein n=1 Tax=Synechococcus sp. CS-1324 TaxID=2847980 RepID=UPI00223BF926|nr:hypothetical protein [Synechococcus sp. CS-1324]MCT0229947.1 hypothetical protein [Synechococcus sp. CS-1324]